MESANLAYGVMIIGRRWLQIDLYFDFGMFLLIVPVSPNNTKRCINCILHLTQRPRRTNRRNGKYFSSEKKPLRPNATTRKPISAVRPVLLFRQGFHNHDAGFQEHWKHQAQSLR